MPFKLVADVKHILKAYRIRMTWRIKPGTTDTRQYQWTEYLVYGFEADANDVMFNFLPTFAVSEVDPEVFVANSFTQMSAAVTLFGTYYIDDWDISHDKTGKATVTVSMSTVPGSWISV